LVATPGRGVVSTASIPKIHDQPEELSSKCFRPCRPAIYCNVADEGGARVAKIKDLMADGRAIVAVDRPVAPFDEPTVLTNSVAGGLEHELRPMHRLDHESTRT
jgi:hypothetical protein